MKGERHEPVPGVFVWRYGGGPRVIVGFHGWSGSHHTFDALLGHLPDDATLYAFDMPGSGISAEPEWDIDGFARPIVAAISALQLEDVTLVGVCAGAVVAMEVALRIPDRTARLVSLDPFTFVPWYFALLTWGWPGKFFYYVTFANPLGRLITNLALASKRKDETDLTGGFAEVRHREAHSFLSLLCSLEFSRYTVMPCEVALVFGENTFGAVKASVEMCRAAWPKAVEHELQSVGHLPLVEATAAVAELAFGEPRLAAALPSQVL